MQPTTERAISIAQWFDIINDADECLKRVEDDQKRLDERRRHHQARKDNAQGNLDKLKKKEW